MEIHRPNRMDTSNIRIFLFASLVAIVFMGFYYEIPSKKNKDAMVMKVSALSLPTPTPTLPFEPIRVDSPDGTKTLTMEYRQGNTYSFTVSDNVENQQQLVATKTISSTETFTVPDNSWSPDNKYVFVKENIATQSSYFVFASSDTLPYQDLQNVDIKALFAERYPDYILSKITGWAAPYLLILNTETQEGERGPSFWFDISTKSFIRLATRF